MPDSPKRKRDLENQSKPFVLRSEFCHSDIKGYSSTTYIEILIANLFTGYDKCLHWKVEDRLQQRIAVIDRGYPLYWITAAPHYRQKHDAIVSVIAT